MTFALEVPPVEGSDDLRRFEREAELLALLDAPGLPRFFDYAPQAERPYIAMGRAPGVPAVRFCRANDKIRLRPAEVVEVGLQVARTLKYLHERGVLHRDINANNVIIELERAPRVMLIDLDVRCSLPTIICTHLVAMSRLRRPASTFQMAASRCWAGRRPR